MKRNFQNRQSLNYIRFCCQDFSLFISPTACAPHEFYLRTGHIKNPGFQHHPWNGQRIWDGWLLIYGLMEWPDAMDGPGPTLWMADAYGRPTHMEGLTHMTHMDGRRYGR